MHFAYKDYTNEYIMKMWYTDKNIIVGSISDDGIQFNESVLLPNLSFKKNDIKQILGFMIKHNKVKLCDAQDCKRKFVPKKSHQKFCCSQCRARAHAQNKKHKSSLV